jgi:hypothetical protein
VRRILKRCVVCRRRYSKPLQQKMSALPEDRVTAGNPPFTTVGVDHFGPFEVKQGRSYVKTLWMHFHLPGREGHPHRSRKLDGY